VTRAKQGIEYSMKKTGRKKPSVSQLRKSGIFVYLVLPVISAIIGGMVLFFFQQLLTGEAPLTLMHQPSDKEIFISYTTGKSNRIEHRQLSDIRFVLINNSGSAVGIKNIRATESNNIDCSRLIVQYVERREYGGDGWRVTSNGLASAETSIPANHVSLDIDKEDGISHLILTPDSCLTIDVYSSKFGIYDFSLFVEYYYQSSIHTLETPVWRLISLVDGLVPCNFKVKFFSEELSDKVLSFDEANYSVLRDCAIATDFDIYSVQRLIHKGGQNFETFVDKVSIEKLLDILEKAALKRVDEDVSYHIYPIDEIQSVEGFENILENIAKEVFYRNLDPYSKDLLDLYEERFKNNREDIESAQRMVEIYLEHFDSYKEDCEPLLRRIILEDPNDSYSYYLKAQYLLRLDKYDDAIGATNMALQLNQTEGMYWYLLAELYAEKELYQKVQDIVYEGMNKVDSDKHVMLALFRNQVRTKEYEDAAGKTHLLQPNVATWTNKEAAE